jgi:hypothetical protein
MRDLYRSWGREDLAQELGSFGTESWQVTRQQVTLLSIAKLFYKFPPYLDLSTQEPTRYILALEIPLFLLFTFLVTQTLDFLIPYFFIYHSKLGP